MFSLTAELGQFFIILLFFGSEGHFKQFQLGFHSLINRNTKQNSYKNTVENKTKLRYKTNLQNIYLGVISLRRDNGVGVGGGVGL